MSEMETDVEPGVRRIEDEYSAESLSLVTLREAIRTRPAMYLGDTDARGLHHLIWEFLYRSLDEHQRGYGDTISVTVNEDGSASVEDNGRGIPVEPVEGLPYLQHVLTTPPYVRLSGYTDWHESGLRSPAGVCCICFLSTWTVADIFRDGFHYRQRFEEGLAVTDLKVVGPSERTGTRITFQPDPTIFRDIWFDPARITPRLRELSTLVPTVRFRFADRREHLFHAPEGLPMMLARESWDRTLPAESFRADEIIDDIEVHVAAHWISPTWRRPPQIKSFANLHWTSYNGTHVTGFRTGLLAGLRAFAPEACRGRQHLGAKLERGMVACISVRLAHPQYGAGTKDQLRSPEVRPAVHQAVKRAFYRALSENAALRERILKALEATFR